MKNSFARIAALTKRNLKEILRDPIGLVFMIALPLVMEVTFYLIFHGMTSQFDMKYLAPGIVVFSQAFLTLFTGLLIALDRSTSFLTRLYVTGTKSYQFIFGYTFSVLPICLVQAVLFFAVGAVIDPSIISVALIPAILLSVVTSLLFIGFGILFGSLCNEKAIGGVSSIVITGQSVLSAMWFPTEGMSGVMMTIMSVLPFKNATDLIQNIIIGVNDAFNDVILPLIIVLAYTVAVLVAAILVFGKKMKDN